VVSPVIYFECLVQDAFSYLKKCAKFYKQFNLVKAKLYRGHVYILIVVLFLVGKTGQHSSSSCDL